MAKRKYIKTKIWRDEWFVGLSRAAKLCFIYLFTNECIGISGIYEVSDRTICFDTGLTQAELDSVKEELSTRVLFADGWVRVINAEKHDPIKGEKNNLWRAREKELEHIPEEIYKKLHPPPKGVQTPFEGSTGKGKGKGIGKQGGSAEGGSPVDSTTHDEIITAFNQAFERNFRLTSSRKKLVSERLRVFGKNKLIEAAKMLSLNPFYRGENDRSWSASPDYLYRSDEQVDKALNMDVSRWQKQKHRESKKSVAEILEEKEKGAYDGLKPATKYF